MGKKANVHTVRTGWRGSGRLAGVIADLVTNVDRSIVAVVVMTTATVLTTVTVVSSLSGSVGVSSMTTAAAPTTAITVVVITV